MQVAQYWQTTVEGSDITRSAAIILLLMEVIITMENNCLIMYLFQNNSYSGNKFDSKVVDSTGYFGFVTD